MSALVWSVESALLGVWALVFSLYSTPFHAFIARSHALIGGVTLLLQLISTARDLPTGHAISEAFVCAVTSLALVYAAAVLDTANHARFFSMPSLGGVLPLDAAIGAAWFCAAMTSAMGMALSGVKKAENQRAALMFHQYGYHMSVVLPSLLMLWLYNYDAKNTSEPVYKGINIATKNGVSITHTLLFVVYACIWGWFVAAQFMGEGVLTMGKEWPEWELMSGGTMMAYFLAATLKFLGRSGCVLIPLSATFSAHTSAQTIMAWVLTGVAAMYALDLMGMVDGLFGKRHAQTPPDTANETTVHTIPEDTGPPPASSADSSMARPTAPPMEQEYSSRTDPINSCMSPQQHKRTTMLLPHILPKYNAFTPNDPAAVVLGNTQPYGTTQTTPAQQRLPLVTRQSAWRRDKMV